MSKSTDGQDLTRVGPGTVMGEMMRQYWIPAALSSELKRDGDPMRLIETGERQLDLLCRARRQLEHPAATGARVRDINVARRVDGNTNIVAASC